MQAKARRAKIDMEFDLTKAQEVAQQHNLSPKTIEVWKHRGEIPSIYFRENSFQESKLMDYLQSPKLNAKAIFAKVGISYNKFIAANRTDQYHVHLQTEDVQILLDEIQKIKTSISLITHIFPETKDFTTDEKLIIEECLNDNSLVVLQVLECQSTDFIYRRYLKRRAKKPAKKFENWECVEYLNKLRKFDAEL